MKKKERVNEMDIFVGARLRQIRCARKIPLELLGHHLGKAWQQIAKYERGENRISAGTLWKISCALGCSVFDFFPDSPIRSRDLTENNRRKILLRMEKLMDTLINDSSK